MDKECIMLSNWEQSAQVSTRQNGGGTLSQERKSVIITLMLFSTLGDSDTDVESPSFHQGFYYGWIIVICCTILLAITVGFGCSYGIFFTSLQEEFDWNRVTTSNVFSLYLLLTGVFSMIGIQLSNSYGPRPVILAAGIVTGLSLMLTSQVDYSWQIYLTYSFLLAMGTGTTFLTILTMGPRWFSHNKLSALWIAGAGVGLGCTVMPPLIAWLISGHGWRDAFQVMAIVAWIVIIPLAILLKRAPALTGSDSENLPQEQFVADDSKESSIADVVRTRDFWVVLLLWFCSSFCLHMVLIHLVPLGEDIGETLNMATVPMVIMGILMIISRLVIGHIHGSQNRKTVGVTLAMVISIAMFWLVDADETWMLHFFAALFGLAWGGIEPSVVSLTRNLWQGRDVELRGAIMYFSWVTGAALGVSFAGAIFYETGEYKFAFFCAAWAMVMTSVFIWSFPIPSEVKDTPSDVDALTGSPDPVDPETDIAQEATNDGAYSNP